jgi:hypothetical protein
MDQFKFKIGDVVGARLDRSRPASDRMLGLVVERYVSECSGGAQRSYSVRWLHPSTRVSPPTIATQFVRMDEIELESVEEEEVSGR